MNKPFVFLLMIFLHIVDDYKLQAGVLAYLKQKSYWQENAPEPLYKFDYIAALIMHSFSWTFMIMLPIAIVQKFNIDNAFCVMFGINMLTHALTDNLKANQKKINLVFDQFIHICQIILTAGVFL